MVALPEPAPIRPLPPVPITAPTVILRRLVLGLIGLAILVWAYQGADMRPYDLYLYRSNMLKYARGFLTLDLLNWRYYLAEMAVTIQIAIWGTLLAIVGAIPCGFLSSSNVVPVWVYQPVRRVMDAARAGSSHALTF